MLKRGDIVAGDYLIDALIGKGGMGCVYRAHLQQNEQKCVAVKELPPTVRLSSGQLVTQGISSQLKLMKRVDHPCIAKLLDVFQWEGMFYCVFDYVSGRSLQSIVANEGAVGEQRALEWISQLCDVLSYLHNLTPPVVYRDMKPSNVILTEKGVLKVVDLGIAREFKDADAKQKDTIAFGTQGYAPPEQYGCAQTDARSDIYALGCTLWHLLAGYPPPMEFPLRSIRSVNTRISTECDELIQCCTQLNRAKRYQTCKHLKQDALKILQREQKESSKKKQGPVKSLARAFERVLQPWPRGNSAEASTNDNALNKQNASSVQANGFATSNKSAIAEWCFSHADAFLFDDRSTALLDDFVAAENRSTGELCGSCSYSGEFFFTVVQTDLCTHDN